MKRLGFGFIFSLAILAGAWVQACPIGMQSAGLKFGVQACEDDSGLRLIKGSATSCPTGFLTDRDRFGNAICRGQGMDAYALKGACPAPFLSGWDAHNRNVCRDFNGKALIELVDAWP